MSLQLDQRQRAMLSEMGVRVWTPAPAPEPAPASASVPGRLAVLADAAAPAWRSEPAEPAALAQKAFGAAIAPAVAMPARNARPAAPTNGTAAASFAEPTGAPGAASALVSVAGPADVDQMDWGALAATVADCRACGLCQSRRNTVFGVGDRAARWMVVGEAPGEQEDLSGEPFVGQGGMLLDNMLRAIGLSRAALGQPADARTAASNAVSPAASPAVSGSAAAAAAGTDPAGVYIANVLKCRPPANRNPDSQEVAQCEPFLRRQVALVRPRVILAMGRFAVQSLLATQEPIGKLRGRVHQYQGVPVIVTYHPAYLLRSLPEKAKAWADLCLALETMRAAGDD